MMFRLSPVLLTALLAGSEARVGDNNDRRQLTTKASQIADLLQTLGRIDQDQNDEVEIPEMETIPVTEEGFIDQIDTPDVRAIDGDASPAVDIPEMEAMPINEEFVGAPPNPNGDFTDTPNNFDGDSPPAVDIPQMEAMPVMEEEVVDMVDTPNAEGSGRTLRGRDRPSRSSRGRTAATPAADEAAAVEIPEMELAPVNEEFAASPSNSGTDTVDTPSTDSAARQADFSSIEIPTMELAPVNEELAGAPPNPNGDFTDTPTNTDGAAPEADFSSTEIPQMEAIPQEFQASEEVVDTPDTPTNRAVDGDAPPQVDIPEMELAPVNEEFAAAPSNSGTDTVDTPNTDGGDADADEFKIDGEGAVDIPQMEAIPEEYLPADLPPVEDGFIQDTPTEVEMLPGDMMDTPTEQDGGVVMPKGIDESYILTGGLAAVCASSQEEANQMCANKLPICKYKKSGNTITAQVTTEEDCVRRCDSPQLGENHCENHQECFQFTFGCECATLDFTGNSECSPF